MANSVPFFKTSSQEMERVEVGQNYPLLYFTKIFHKPLLCVFANIVKKIMNFYFWYFWNYHKHIFVSSPAQEYVGRGWGGGVKNDRNIKPPSSCLAVVRMRYLHIETCARKWLGLQQPFWMKILKMKICL